MIPGDHYTVIKSPILAQQLSSYLYGNYQIREVWEEIMQEFSTQESGVRIYEESRIISISIHEIYSDFLTILTDVF